MKAILISIQPKWVAKILNGEKGIEIRKTKPNVELPIDVYIYCTKSNYLGFISKRYAGKVVAKFTLNKVEEIKEIETIYGYKKPLAEYLKESCLSFDELKKYLNGKGGYAWHISNLEIFDKPKELNEFEHYNLTEKSYRRFPYCDFNLTKAPQSYMFIEVRE